MTQDEIIEMWHKAWPDNGAFVRASAKDLEAFAKLVAAKEREACAQTCENLPIPDQYSDSEGSMWDVAAIECAEAIRARGNAVCGFPVVIDESIPHNQFEIRARGERQ